MKLHSTIPLLMLLFTISILSFSCKKDNSFFDGIANITFDQDTLSFDTIFTKVGSSTKFIKIFNNENKNVQVNIRLKNNNPQFRINVDGNKGRIFENIEILAKDSIYVFVEATVNPDDPLSISPFIIEDALIIEQGSSSQEIIIIANGQNANYIPRVSSQGSVSYLSCQLNSVRWDDPKPYVIYGILVIDSCELILPAGARVYVHGGLAKNDNQFYNDGQIIVLQNGKLNIQGDIDNKVTIQGDRLEAEYKDQAGQWGGIRIFKNSKGNRMENVIIKNSIVGISIDSASDLTLSRCIIQNVSTVGIYARHSEVKADNILIYGSGSYSVAMAYGGQYQFQYCSFTSDIGQDESILANNYQCSDPLCTGTVYFNPLTLKIDNSIVVGGSEDEVALDPIKKSDLGTNAFELNMKNCIVKVKDLIKEDAYPQFFDYCQNCYNLKSNDKLFLDKSKSDYRLDTLSVALEKAYPIFSLDKDLIGKIRDTQKPDIGCYEF